MQFRAYIYIAGEGFDPDEFNRNLPSDMKGTVHTTKKVGAGRKPAVGFKYWMSAMIDVRSEHPEETLYRILFPIKEYLKEIQNISNIMIKATVVGNFKNANAVQGLFLPNDLIQLLAEVGAGVDFDLVWSPES